VQKIRTNTTFKPKQINVAERFKMGICFTSDSAGRVFFYKGFRLESFLQVIPVGKLFKSGSAWKYFFQVIPVRGFFTSDFAGRVCFTSDSGWRAFYKWFKLDSILIRW